MELYLNFFDYIILVSSKEEGIIGKIREEFHFFIQTQATHVDMTLEIQKGSSPDLPPLVATKILENAVIYRLGLKQYIDYFGEALIIWDHGEETIRMTSQNEDHLFELAFLSIHSVLGQALDKKGFCRIHALGVSLGNVNALIMLPSKGGKSTLLLHLLRHDEIQIISDDMPIIDHLGFVHPFPSKISLEQKPQEGPLSKLTWHEFKRTYYPPKWSASLSQLKERIDTEAKHHKNLLIAGFRLSLGPSRLAKVPKWKMAGPMMEHMIIGFGLPQILEMFLKFRWTDFFKLIFHALIRTFCAFQLVRKSQCYFFYMGPDKSSNAQLIMDRMNDHQHT